MNRNDAWRAFKAEKILTRFYNMHHDGSDDDKILNSLREEGLTDADIAQAFRVIATEFNWKRL